MHRPTSAWTRTASTAKSARASPRSRSASRESPSIALTSMPGLMTISSATDVPRLTPKGPSHGKPKDVGPHQTRWGLAHRQSVQRRPHLRKHWNRRSREGRGAARPADVDYPRRADLRHSNGEDVPGGGDEVPQREPAQAEHPQRCSASEAARPLHRGSAAEARPHGLAAGLYSQAQIGWRKDEDDQRLAGNGPPHRQSRSVGVDRRARHDVVRALTEDQALPGRRRPRALSALIGGAGAAVSGTIRHGAQQRLRRLEMLTLVWAETN